MGLGVFAVYASSATVFHYSYVFMKKHTLNMNTMNETMNTVMMLSNGVSQNLTGITEYSKAKKAFASVFSTLNTKTLILL